MPAKKQPEKKQKKVSQAAPIENLPDPTPVAAPVPAPDVKLVLDQQEAPATPPTPVQPGPVSVQSPPPSVVEAALPAGKETVETVTGEDDFEPEHGGHMTRIVLIFLTALLVGGAAVAGFLYYFPKNKTVPAPPETPTPAVSISQKEEPVASDSAEKVDVSALTVQILNGSGVAGEAARVRDELETAGFTTFSLGNAESYDFTDTHVQIKEGLPEGIFVIVESALSSYTSVLKEPLAKTSSYDIVITAGKQK